MGSGVPRELVWVTLFGAGVAYEVHEVRGKTGGTLSEVVRETMRVDTPAGRAAFLLGWGAFAAWFATHIVSGPNVRLVLPAGCPRPPGAPTSVRVDPPCP